MSKLWRDQLRQTTFAGDLVVWRPHGVPTRSPVTTLLLWVHTVEDDLREIVSFSQSAAVWPCQQVQFDSKCFPPSNRLSIVLFTDGGSVTSERSTFLDLGRRTKAFFVGKKFARWSKSQWLVVVRGETENDRRPCQLQLPWCMNRRLKTRLTQGQFVAAATGLATRTSQQWHRGRAPDVSDEGLNFAAERKPRLTVHAVFFCFFQNHHICKSGCHANAIRHFQANQETAHTCRERERERERERHSKDRQNWRLLDWAQYFEKVRAHSVSIPTGVRRFPIVGERTITQNWYKLGYGSTPRPDATRAFAHNLQNLENYTINFRDRPLKTKLVEWARHSPQSFP